MLNLTSLVSHVLKFIFFLQMVGLGNVALADNPVCLSSSDTAGVKLYRGLQSRDGPVPQNGKNFQARENGTTRYHSGFWLALACKEMQCRLAQIELKVRTIHPVDDYYGCAVYQKLNWGLSVLDKNERVIMLFQPDPALKEGPVTTWYIRPTREWIPMWERGSKVDETIRIPTPTKINQDRISVLSTLWVNNSHCKQGQARNDGCLEKTVRIQLKENGVVQWLSAPFRDLCPDFTSEIETYFNRDYLTWVGDLDGDQKPDYLLSTDNIAQGAEILFLSSKAGPKQLVGKAGSYVDDYTCD